MFNKKENKFQAEIIEKIKARLPGCVVTKQDPNYIQGIPDIEVHKNGRYAWLEVKKDKNAKHQPNQDYYISKARDDGAFAAFIYPENAEEILDAMVQSFKA